MSPELLHPELFGFADSRLTKESDCYALGMVILEVLTGQVPFACYEGYVVMRKVVDGERPERPKGRGSQMIYGGHWNCVGHPDRKGALLLRPCLNVWKEFRWRSPQDSRNVVTLLWRLEDLRTFGEEIWANAE